MKKLIILLFIIPLFHFSQCTVNNFDLKLMHKDLNFAENFIFSDIYTTNYEKNFGIKKFKPTSSFDYLDNEHDTDYISFTYKNNYLKRDSEYTLKTIDKLIYSIEVKFFYSEHELKEFENDYLKIKNCITSIYKIHTMTGFINNKFQESKDSELIERKTGTTDSYERKTRQRSSIWKINDFEISKKKEYIQNSNGLLGFSNTLKGYSIILKFTDLNGTILDNRGY
jgi:hypothetical protein